MQQELKQGFSEFRQLDIKELGRRLRCARQDRKLTREELAEKVNRSATFIADIEYGEKYPSVRSLYQLCQALAVPADYLLAGSSSPRDEESEIREACNEIMTILGACDLAQLKGFRDISMIYVEAISRSREQEKKL